MIHRDLKPSNIIVMEEALPEGSRSKISGLSLPEIKILDFGLARITEGDLAAATMTAEVGVIKGTLPYMSPEQTRGNPDEIDLRTDVYSLGVVLFEMLAGQRPYDVIRKSVVEAVRVICEEPPRALGTSITGVRRLDPDVETIVGRALEKDANRRYSSATALSDDIGRYLTSQPILARPPSTAYQLRKLVERNKLATTFAATVLALLVGSGGWLAVLYARALNAEDEATREAASATQVSEFLTDLFRVSDPSEARGNTLTAREILDRGARRVERELSDQPEVQAQMMATIGNVYWGIGLLDQAEPLLRNAFEIRVRVLGHDHPDTLQSVNRLGYLLKNLDRLDEAEAYHRQALEGRRRVLGDKHPDTLKSLHDVGLLLRAQGKPDEAEPYYRRSLEGLRRVLGDEHPDTLPAINNMGLLLQELGELEQAEGYFREALEVRSRVSGGDHPATLTAMHNLAGALLRQGKLDDAETYLSEALAERRRVLGDEHPDTLTSRSQMGSLRQAQGHQGDAERHFREVLEIRRDTLGEDHRATLLSLEKLAGFFRQTGQTDQAERYYREELQVRRRTSGPDDPRTLEVLTRLGLLIRDQGRLDEAEGFLREALEIQRRKQPEPDEEVATALIRLGILLNRQGRHAQAELLLRECLEIRSSALAADHWLIPNTKSNLGETLVGQERFEDAEPLLVEAYHALADHPLASTSRKDAALQRVIDLYDAWGKPHEAATWRALSDAEGDQRN